MVTRMRWPMRSGAVPLEDKYLGVRWAAINCLRPAHVEERAVRVEVELPRLLAKLAGGIKQSLEQQGRKLLSAR